MIAVFGACKSAHRHEDASPRPVAAVAVVADAPPADAGDAGESKNHITFSIKHRPPPGSALGIRCTLSGAPILSNCRPSGVGLAIGDDGMMFIVAGTGVQRYTRAAADRPRECRFESTGGAVALPTPPARAQSIDGPVYMRSGGPDWSLFAFDHAIYALDFLGGLYRLAHGAEAFVPACLDVFGYQAITELGGKLMIARTGLQRLAPGRKCTASSAKIDDKARGLGASLHTIHDHLYLTDAGGGTITRYDGKIATPVTSDLCSVSAFTACGDGACAFDNNCKKVLQLDATDTVVRTIDDDTLFETSPYGLHAAVTAADGTVFVLVTDREHESGPPGPDHEDVCETVLYELPPALFAR